MDNQTVYRLLEQIRNGNKEAFANLVEPYIAGSYRAALAILRSTHLAEEAVQNALIETYQAIQAGKEIRHFAAWFNHLAARRALDLARKEGRHSTDVDIDHVMLQDTAALPVDEVLKKEQSSQLLDAVMALEIEQRSVIVLYYFQEMKISEIAALLKLSEGNVRTRLYRARLSLSKLVAFPELKEKVVRL